MKLANEYTFKLLKNKKALESQVDKLYAQIYLVAVLAIIEAIVVIGFIVSGVVS